MDWLRGWLKQLRVLVRRAAVERELEDELAFHLEMETAKNIAAGMSPEEARRAALLEFGGVERYTEQVRDARWVRWVEALGADVRYAWRGLRRSPGFAAVVVLTLGVGIGANSALFGLLDGLVSRMPPGIAASERLVRVDNAGGFEEVSHADYRDLRAATSAQLQLAALMPVTLALGSGGDPVQVSGQMVSANYFDVVGVAPVLGRGFLAREDETPGAYPVVVLGHGLWRERFGSDPAVVGRAIVVNGQSFTVVGVAPQAFVGTDIENAADLWVPAAMQPMAMPREYDVLGSRTAAHFKLLGRLRPDVSREQAQAALVAAGKGVEEVYPAERFRPLRPEVERLDGWIRRSDLLTGSGLPVIAFAWVVTGLILLISCANVVNMMLARAVVRRREIGIRLAMGAGGARLVRLLLTEALLLALIAGALGVVLAYWGAEALRVQLTEGFSRLDVSPDASTLLFTLAVAVLTGLAFGLVPAWRASRPSLVPAIKGDDPSWLRRTRLQGGLVAAQVALSLALLVAAGLLLGRFLEIRRVDVGYDADRVAALSVNLHAHGYTPEARDAFFAELRERAARLPGVEAVVGPTFVPYSPGAALTTVATEDQTGPEATGATPSPGGPRAVAVGIGAGFFQALGTPLLRGRAIEERDLRSGERVAVVTESLARRLWPGEDPIGQRFRFGRRGAQPLEVIGITGEVVLSSIAQEQLPKVFLPEPQHFQMDEQHVLVRTAGEPGTVLAAVREDIRQMDHALPVVRMRILADEVASELAFHRMVTGVITGFGALALLLAAFGLYGIVAFTVAGRSREIGVRLALGAQARQVVRVFVRDGLRLTLVGLTVGGLFSVAVARLLGSVFEGVRVVDPLVFLAVGATLAGVAVLASWVPARRAARVDPMVTLRAE